MGATGDVPRRRGESALHAWAAKTSRPRVSVALVRERLFARLRAASDRPVVWVSAPAGAGKTTLAASYTLARRRPVLWYTFDEGDAELATFFHHLGSSVESASPRKSPPLPRLTPEYVLGVPAFSRRFFEKLFGRVERRCVLVFDNFQELPAANALQRLLADAVAAFPRGAQLLVLSRGAPPAAWARLVSQGALAILSWKDLRLTPVEARGMLRLLCRSRGRSLHAGTVEELVRGADGWAAGLVLMLEAIGAAAPEIQVASASRRLLFDYFASEIFDGAPLETQEWLLRSALLPSVTGPALAVLCRDERPERILAVLSERNYFMVKLESDPDTYQYHPLFRDFLLQRAMGTWSPRTLRARRRQAAAALLSSGQVWASVELLLLCKDWDAAAGSILQLLPGLVSQGRFQVAVRWLSTLPTRILVKTPWLLYWRGVCGLAPDPSGARHDFESAYRAFERLGDAAGMYLTLAEALRSTWGGSFDFVQMDCWLDRFDRVSNEYPQLPAEIEAQVLPSLLMGLYFRRLSHPRIPYWLGRGQALLRTALPPPVRGAILCSLGWHLYGSRAFRGWILQLSSLEAASDGPPLYRLSQLVSIGYGSLYAGECGRARTAARDGLALAEETGIHTFDLMLLGIEVEAALLIQDLPAADAALTRLGRLLAAVPSDFFGSFEAYVRCWRALLGGERAAAVELGRRSVTLSEGSGALYPIASCRYALSHALLEADRTQEGLEWLERSRLRWPGAEHEHQAFLCELTEAWVRLRRGERDRAESLLWRALERGEAMGYGPPMLARPSFLQPLFRLALEQNRYAKYVGWLIGRARLAPPGAEVAVWPTPVRVRTLGGLAVTVDGTALRPDLPRQKRPLELLQALIASGGRDVHKERLCDALWPDATGDKAAISLNTTLHRLRKLLSRDHAIVLKNGRLSLAPGLVWVDVWGLQVLLDEIESGLASTRSDAPRLEELQRRLPEVYRGRFLDGEPERGWSLALAERLQQRVLRAAQALTHYWRRKGDAGRAIATCEWALQIDPACEELCREMMRLHAARGERGAAMSTFRRLRQALSLQGDTQPSPQTLALFESVRSGTTGSPRRGPAIDR